MSESIRRTSVACRIGDVTMGAGAPVVVQSMTNTDTADAVGTAAQVADLARAGSEIVRITVNNRASAAKVAEIRQRLEEVHGVNVPLVGDFHYNGHTLLREFPDCADALDKYRINPGNVGRGARHDANFAEIVRVAIDYDRPVRIGVNFGSLDPELLGRADGPQCASPGAAVGRGGRARGDDRKRPVVGRGGRGAGARTRQDRALVQGQPPAGDGQRLRGARGALRLPAAPRPDRGRDVQQGDRRHLGGAGGLAPAGHRGHDPREPDARARRRPHASRSGCAASCSRRWGSRQFRPQVTACPGCGRTTSTVFQELAQRIEAHLAARMEVWGAERPGRGRPQGRRDGLHRQRAGGEPGGRHRHQPAREPGSRRGRRCTWTARRCARSRAITWPRSSSRWSRPTSRRATRVPIRWFPRRSPVAATRAR